MTQKNDSAPSFMQTPQYKIVFRDPESILKKQLGDDISVVDFESESFSKAGDNYGSTMMKITVSVTRRNEDKVEKLHLIGKLLPPTDKQRKIFESDYTFQKEIFFYEQLIPIYQDIYKKKFEIVPQYYGSRISLESDTGKISEDTVVLLENLKIKGYYMQDRLIGLGLEHLKVLVPAIAKFHAIGLSIKHKKPSFLPILEKYTRRLGALDIHNQFVERMLSEIENHPELNEYDARIKTLYDESKNVANFFYKTLKMEDPWASIVHVDLWNNNVLFHNDEDGNIDDVKIVDFQTYTVISPLTDLIFLLCSSMQYPLEHFDLMTELYRATICKTLEELNCDVYSFAKQPFAERLKTDAKSELFHLIMMTNAVEFREGDDFEKGPANEFTIRRLKRVFEIFEQKKWF